MQGKVNSKPMKGRMRSKANHCQGAWGTISSSDSASLTVTVISGTHLVHSNTLFLLLLLHRATQLGHDDAI